MKPETLQALQESIAHWERMKTDRYGFDRPCSGHCPLCQRFFDRNPQCQRADGELCPVQARTGRALCRGTPYQAADYAFYHFDIGTDSSAEWRTAAQAEIDFLQSLLPEKEDACSQCGEPNDNGEGWDGLCGNCADKKEAAQP